MEESYLTIFIQNQLDSQKTKLNTEITTRFDVS